MLSICLLAHPALLPFGRLSTNLGAKPLFAQYLNPNTRLIILMDGEPIEIVRFMDIDGQDTDDLDEAIACVAGPDLDGNWYTMPIHDDVRTTIH